MSENRRLTEMLKAMFHHCNTLQNQLDDVKNREIEALRKRKHEKEESSSSEEGSPNNKRRTEICKLKISRVYVQSNASDISLVSICS